MKIDLHAHSTASDGVLSPAELVQRAHEQGVRVFSLTDHDTLRGLLPARETADSLGMHLVNGIEVSCVWGGATIHVLGYDFHMENRQLAALVDELYNARMMRAHEISRRLAKAGFSDTLAGALEVQQQLGATGSPPARPHFAEHMVRAGYAKDHAEAFKKWLGAGKAGDVKQHWPGLEKIMPALTDAGAKISLAHPCHYKFTRTKRLKLLRDFVGLGGHAVEVSNGMQPAEQVGMLSAMVRENGLKATAGSDFHAPHTFSELGRYRTPANDLQPLWHEFALPDALRQAYGV